MQAALELARAGADVTLFEKSAELGGQLRIAREVPGRETVGSLVRDLGRDLAAAGVAVRLDTEADAALLRSGGYDAVAVATGAVAPARTTLALGGAYEGGMPHGTIDAFTALRGAGESFQTAEDAPRSSAKNRICGVDGRRDEKDGVERLRGGRIAVVDDDGTAYASGVVLTLLAAVDGLELITPFETVFPHVGSGYDRPLLLEQLSAHPGFRRHVASRVEGLAPLTLRDVLTGETAALERIDAVVAIEPRQSVRPGGQDAETLSAALDGRPVVLIGDAVTPRRIDDAINDAVELVYARPPLPVAAQ
jgi:hypothetical protein